MVAYWELWLLGCALVVLVLRGTGDASSAAKAQKQRKRKSSDTPATPSPLRPPSPLPQCTTHQAFWVWFKVRCHCAAGYKERGYQREGDDPAFCRSLDHFVQQPDWLLIVS